MLNQARERFLALWHEGATAPANPQPVSVAVSLSTAEGAGGGVGGQSQSASADHPSPPHEDDFIQFLVSANQRAQSWREKLDFVRGFLADETRALTTGHLLDLAIYLRFLGTGEIPCAEDGRHFRPSHHAKISIQIQERLAQLHTPENGFILRKIYPWLPSSGAEFMRAEPLTRIRDLAHRNDIPSGLKRELKQTLQNKLHRCAGPEDLATSAALLTRLTAPGADYPAAFVEQFKVFHAELREFFNARSLDERLETLARTIPRRRRREETLTAEAPDLIHRFLAAKRRMNGDAETALAALRRLLELRRHLLTGLEMNSGVESQELLLADIGLEDFSFVLLSELNRALEAGRQSIPWAQLTEALALTLASLAFSGVETDECRALEAECHAWRASFDPRDREQLLRLKATADRARRLAEDFSDHLLALFPPRAEKLGRALGVAEHAVRQFCEGEIRAHVVFQLSKLVSGLSPPIRAAAALPHWDVLVGGRTTGTLTAVDSLDGISVAAAGPLIALLRHAEGDEEIPSGVTGVILAHELPHLSHLAVRARQGGVVLVACEEAAKFHETARLAGQWVVLDATPDQVTVAVTAEPKTSPLNAAAPRRLRVPDVSLLQPAGSWLPLAQATPENAGGKAAGALRLAQISQRPNAGFKTPPGIVIPFGVMAHALRAAPALEADYGQWLRRLGAMEELDAAAEQFRRLVFQLEVPAELSRIVAGQFGEGARLMVRSSANCEDLENLAGAGLYDSVANVAPADVASAVRAVWASLWTRRATLSRQQAGLPHARAHMAVLIQPMVAPDVSFILHTVNPINQNAREVYVELVAGLGETLASAATRGQPWRLICDKQSGQTTTLAFANFSEALWPNPAGGLARRRVIYSQMALSRDAASRPRLGARLAAIARTVEEGFGRPQDIEGVVAGEDIYLVQSRPQPGIE